MMNKLLFGVNSTTAFDYAEANPYTPSTNNTIKDYPIDLFNQSWLSETIKKISFPQSRILPTSLFEIDVTTEQPLIIIGKLETYDKKEPSGWSEGYMLDSKQTDEIISYVEKREHLKDIIISARNEILRYFPNDKLMITVFHDPEEKQERNELVIHIISSLDPETALQLLDDFDENWWLDKSQGIEDELCIHLVTL